MNRRQTLKGLLLAPFAGLATVKNKGKSKDIRADHVCSNCGTPINRDNRGKRKIPYYQGTCKKNYSNWDGEIPVLCYGFGSWRCVLYNRRGGYQHQHFCEGKWHSLLEKPTKENDNICTIRFGTIDSNNHVAWWPSGTWTIEDINGKVLCQTEKNE